MSPGKGVSFPGLWFNYNNCDASKMPKTLDAWRTERQTELSAPDSWLGLVGLYWLDKPLNRVGADPACEVRMPGGPAQLGILRSEGRGLIWQPEFGEAVALKTDRDGRPDIIESGTLAFFVLERDGRFAVRVRDRAWKQRIAFSGVDHFPEDAAWCIEANWEPLSPPLRMEVPNVLGELKPVEVAFKAVFTVGGQRVELLPMAVAEHEIFFVFRDRTSGRESYGAGRFLKAEAAEAGIIRLDFNRAYNPPCAFTPFATCPLPPPENWLPFAVTAGELKPDIKH